MPGAPSAVQLRFDVRRSPSLPEGVRGRLMALAGRQLPAVGIVLIPLFAAMMVKGGWV